MAVKSEGHVAVSTKTSRYISFSESLLRYVLSVAHFTQFTHSLREKERTKLVTIQLRFSDTEVLMFLGLLT